MVELSRKNNKKKLAADLAQLKYFYFDIDITSFHFKIIDLVYLNFSKLLFIIFFLYIDMYQGEVWKKPEEKKYVFNYVRV